MKFSSFFIYIYIDILLKAWYNIGTNLQSIVQILQYFFTKGGILMHNEENMWSVIIKNEEKILSVLANMQEDISNLNVKVDRLDTRMDNLETRMNNLEIRMDNLETRMDNLETKVANLDTKVANLDTKVADLDIKVANLDTRIGSVEGNVNSLRTDVNSLTFRITRLERSHYDLCDEVTRMHLDIETKLIPIQNEILSCYLSTFERYKDSTKDIEQLKVDVDVSKTTVEAL